eukprot:Sspe_Gene.120018::Locus_117595_Transcript_1_1_Confidence_1.000_Length_457::g.120018::m.120018
MPEGVREQGVRPEGGSFLTLQSLAAPPGSLPLHQAAEAAEWIDRFSRKRVMPAQYACDPRSGRCSNPATGRAACAAWAAECTSRPAPVPEYEATEDEENAEDDIKLGEVPPKELEEIELLEEGRGGEHG